MANIQINVGQLTTQIDASDAHAAPILESALRSIRGNGAVDELSSQERLDALLSEIVASIRQKARDFDDSEAKAPVSGDTPNWE